MFFGCHFFDDFSDVCFGANTRLCLRVRGLS
jgi:hypothetical protein